MKKILIALTVCLILSGCHDENKENYELAMQEYADGNYEEALRLFKSLEDYSDSSEKAEEVAEIIIEGFYQDAISYMEKGDYSNAQASLNKLNNYKDSEKLKMECATELEREYAIDIFDLDDPATCVWFEAHIEDFPILTEEEFYNEIVGKKMTKNTRDGWWGYWVGVNKDGTLSFHDDLHCSVTQPDGKSKSQKCSSSTFIWSFSNGHMNAAWLGGDYRRIDVGKYIRPANFGHVELIGYYDQHDAKKNSNSSSSSGSDSSSVACKLVVQYMKDDYEFYDFIYGEYSGDKFTSSVELDAAREFGISVEQVKACWGNSDNHD